MDREQHLEKIYRKGQETSSLFSSYWEKYSDFGNWHFWLVLASLIIPLVLLYFTVDRKRIFEVFFFGYTVHIMWTYTELALTNSGYVIRGYYLTPLLPRSINITASVLPIGFLLLYQYCTNHKKSFMLYTLVLSAVFAFILAPIEGALNIIELKKGITSFHFYVIDLIIAFLAYWFTRFILKLRQRV
jgi:hypothetical protein